MDLFKKYKILTLSVIGIVLIAIYLLFWEDGTEGRYLAKIGDRTITVEEFLQRSELTIRPNNFKDKETKIDIHTLIKLKIENGKIVIKNY